VIDGRDIGTVIAPEAPAKLFVTASPRSAPSAAGNS
jgi:cytidylate kinase